MNILGIDIGAKGGYAIRCDGELMKSNVFLFDRFEKTYRRFKDIIDEWKITVLITAKINIRGANFSFHTPVSHLKTAGVLALLCEQKKVKFVMEYGDSTMRKEVLGKGNGRNKELVHETYNGITRDVSDAILFTDFYHKLYE